MLFLMTIASNFLSSHRVPIPPDAPLELNAAAPFFSKIFYLFGGKLSPPTWFPESAECPDDGERLGLA